MAEKPELRALYSRLGLGPNFSLSLCSDLQQHIFHTLIKMPIYSPRKFSISKSMQQTNFIYAFFNITGVNSEIF